MLISENQKLRIEGAIKRNLLNSISTYEVINWLNNFQENELDLALEVLENIEYYTTAKTLKIFNEKLKDIFSNYSQKHVIFLAIGDFAKSGTTMLYFLKKTPSFRDKRYKRIKSVVQSMYELPRLLEKEAINKDDFLLILIDDFIGTGNSTLTFLEGDEKNEGLFHYLISQSILPSFAILSIIINTTGKDRLNHKYPHIFISAEKRDKVFSPPSVFGYRPRMLPIREMCYKYGKSFGFPKSKSELGFENSQALVAFSHTTPNNSLPILWSAKNNWIPLYPRFGEDYIENLERYKKESYYWLNIAIKLNIKGFEKKNQLFYEEDIQLISTLRLKISNRATPIICKVLDITLSEYEEIICEGIKRGLFLKNGQPSKLGRKAFSEIQKLAVLKEKKSHLISGSVTRDIVYLPLTFGGKM